MPGPLVSGHAKLEKECNSCHEPFSRQSQTRLCIACHKDTAADRRDRQGFHGRHADALSKDCKYCHTDHKGRNADIVQLDRETFNHTRHELRAQGRPQDRSLRRLPCSHGPVPPRRRPLLSTATNRRIRTSKRLGEKCDGCHSEDGWRRVKAFDHSKTKFALDGAHKEVGCAACHAGERYKDLPTTCVSCHRLQDAHAGPLRRQVRDLPRLDQVEDGEIQSRPDDQVPAARRAHEGQMRYLSHRRPLSRQARNDLRLLPQEG